MSVQSIRYDVEIALRCQLSDKTWEYLERRYVGLYFKRRMQFHHLVEEAKTLLELSGQTVPSGELSIPLFPGRPPAVRQEAISLILAQDAAQDPEVAAFREKFLGSR